MDFYSCEICKNIIDFDDAEVCLVCRKKYCFDCYTTCHHYCKNCNTKILNKKFDKFI